MSDASKFRVTRSPKFWFAFIVTALVATACFPGEAPDARHDGPAVLRVQGDGFLDLPAGASAGHSVIFSEADAQRIGVPAENELIATATGIPMVELEMEAFFVGVLESSPPVVLGCFDPIDVRNDATGEVELSIVEYCPADHELVYRDLVFRGVFTEIAPGWTYTAEDGRVVVDAADG